MIVVDGREVDGMAYNLDIYLYYYEYEKRKTRNEITGTLQMGML